MKFWLEYYISDASSEYSLFNNVIIFPYRDVPWFIIPLPIAFMYDIANFFTL